MVKCLTLRVIDLSFNKYAFAYTERLILQISLPSSRVPAIFAYVEQKALKQIIGG